LAETNEGILRSETAVILQIYFHNVILSLTKPKLYIFCLSVCLHALLVLERRRSTGRGKEGRRRGIHGH
jgi:hypothetical protein